MTTTYGALSIPVAVPPDPETAAVGDPALDVLASFLKAYVNTYGVAAWASVFPREVDAQQIPPILTTWTHQPTDETIAPFNERYLPALFLYRAGGGDQKWEMLDKRVARDTVTLLWIFPTGAQAAERIRVPYVNALVKLIDAGVEAMLDPCWSYPSDPDPLAPSLVADPNAIKLAIATSASAQSYSGAALNGAIGGGAFAQPRAATVTLMGSAADYVNSSTVTFTGLDVLGLTQTQTVTIVAASVPYTLTTSYAFTQITSIAVQAQATTAGTMEFGLSAFAGRGSLVTNFAPTGLRRAGQWKAQPITIPVQMGDKTTTRHYDAVEIPMETYEWIERDGLTLNGLQGKLVANEGGFVQEIRVI